MVLHYFTPSSGVITTKNNKVQHIVFNKIHNSALVNVPSVKNHKQLFVVFNVFDDNIVTLCFPLSTVGHRVVDKFV